MDMIGLARWDWISLGEVLNKFLEIHSFWQTKPPNLGDQAPPPPPPQTGQLERRLPTHTLAH